MSGKRPLVLITGASGFVGHHTLNEFLQRGYSVRITVRSKNSGDSVIAIHKKFANALEYTIVPDLTVEGAFDEAVKNVEGVIHMASPFVTKVANNEFDLLVPAVKGTTRVLESIAAHAPKVKKVVITSSFAAVNNFYKGLNPGYVYTEKDWNPITYGEAKSNNRLAYAGSKKLAEEAAWDFVKKNNSAFTIATICPPMIYGPSFPDSISLNHLGTSPADIYALMNGSLTEVPSTVMPSYADVRDVALAHLRAFESEEFGRFLIASGRWSKQEVCDLFREKFPQLRDRVPVGTPGDKGPDCYLIDASRAHSVLGIEFTKFEDTFADMAETFLKMEKQA